MTILSRFSGKRASLGGILAIALLAATLPASGTARAAEYVNVILDQATIEKLPDHASTVVIGNPLIADVSIQAGGLLVVTGKGYGITNLVAFDRGGAVLMDKLIRVQGATDAIVVVYRGIERESYSCTPICERRVTLGDTASFFDATLGQAGRLIGQAQGGVGQSIQR